MKVITETRHTETRHTH